MAAEVFDCVETEVNSDSRTLRSVQSNETVSRLPGVALMGLLAATIVGPQIGFLGYVFASPELRATVAGQPQIAVALALALVFWIGLIVWPLHRGVQRLARRRTIEIKCGAVTVSEISPWSQANWTLPLASYRGVAHIVRASLSGLRHEAVLVHANADHSLVLSASAHMTDRELAELSAVLDLDILSVGEIAKARQPARLSTAAVKPGCIGCGKCGELAVAA